MRNIGLILAVLIGVGWLIWRTPTSQVQQKDLIDEAVQADGVNPTQRRQRKGPRKPPTTASAPAKTPLSSLSEVDTASEEANDAPTATDEALIEKERKLQEYLEHLDVLDKPNVAELTMLGEMAFDANQAEDAYEHYLEVIENHTDDPMAPFALYKLAWTEYNLGDVDAAIDDMELVLEWLGEGDSPMHQTLRNESPKDLELFRSKTD